MRKKEESRIANYYRALKGVFAKNERGIGVMLKISAFNRC